MLTNIILWILIGLVVGVLARLVLPGRQGIGWVATILIGIVAALLGGFISYQLLGVDDNGGIKWIPLLISVALAAIGIGVYTGSIGRGSRSRI
ncbi:GlsB/YeaQ/YmgE family stress response membrane protein [Luteipulveratus sp. YIM 133132]|uniref:GlsB/YeaQ/YmgE family stress response membrane protein n=1 Tax=Luteipulveratus flavus TaxID=3031728 RepID=A0ABT6CCA6_9MICO|nr:MULTISPECIES: GlsB/YeaQ/YmgE family stress response membrane protein [unclassified Luteipulveratus]MDE9364277.1 GlsB/YeaQ/YmgE family stress response membrane protein [Luteipulveratus sp. YIM 133132]MDF8266519.1 GlsB/YeaQ/YmgE family stress response membrane protein [Luteipulveratus sp. YIM 133296]